MTSRPSDAIGVLTLAELEKMSPEQVGALDLTDRDYRRDRLLADTTIVDLGGAAAVCGLTYAAATKWRNNYLRTGREAANALPAPLNATETRQPRTHPDEVVDNRGKRPAPVWYKGRIRLWGVRNGNLDEDLFPRPGGRAKPGRPRKTSEIIGK